MKKENNTVVSMSVFIMICLFITSACMDYGPKGMETFSFAGKGLFIVNEGNFQYGNASLSYYNTETRQIENEVFVRTNGIPLGDVAQSMVVHGDLGYIVVNNSGVIFVIDKNTFKLKGRISGLTSPRYIHFLNDEKAYVTDLYAKSVTIINPQTLTITGRIDVNNHSSSFYQHPTEQMVQYKNLVFINCWSFDDKILVIDSHTDQVIDSITVCKQPTSLVIDKNNQIWTVNDGGYKGSPYGQVAPGIYKIDAETRKVVDSIKFNMNDHLSEVRLNGSRDTLYFINKSIFRMDVGQKRSPEIFYENKKNTKIYGLEIDPETSEVYIADAIDYVQKGVVYRLSATGVTIDTFRTGVIPGAFCFKK